MELPIESLFGYLGATAMGVILGLLGGGGAILTVPLLVYLFHVPPVSATSYSLFIVGLTSLLGSIRYAYRKDVDVRVGLLFSIPAMISVVLTRKLVLPSIPDPVFSFGHFLLGKDALVLIVFASLMVAASFSMIKKRSMDSNRRVSVRPGMIMLYGVVVGFLTGFVGAGGGFLITPALVFFVALEMKKAVGTSLMIIAINSFFGFMADVQRGAVFGWTFLLSFVGFALVGMSLGMMMSKKIPGHRLKPLFGWFILAMGLFILYRQIFAHS